MLAVAPGSAFCSLEPRSHADYRPNNTDEPNEHSPPSREIETREVPRLSHKAKETEPSSLSLSANFLKLGDTDNSDHDRYEKEREHDSHANLLAATFRETENATEDSPRCCTRDPRRFHFAERQRSATRVLGTRGGSAAEVPSIRVGCSAWFGFWRNDAIRDSRCDMDARADLLALFECR